MGSTALWCVANSALNVLQKLAAEAYMRTQPEHSWNDNNLVARLFLYQLQCHSDHHDFTCVDSEVVV